jgi:hypothetical protein
MAPRAAVQELHAAADMEFVPLGVATKVVMVVEDQDPRALRRVLQEEVRGRQAADPAPTTIRS